MIPDNLITIDRRDLNSMRERLCALEESNRKMAQQMALFMNGTKERFDAFSLLLDRLKAEVAGKDV